MKEDPKTYIKVIAQLCPAKLEAVIDHRHHLELDDNSITGVLEIVAKEAGIENAMMLAEMFGLQVSDDLTSGITLLPPNRAEEVCPFDPVTNRANYRNWYHKRHGGFPEDFEE